jgi:WXG100 family type VII secretion target
MAILLEADEARSHADDVRTTSDNLASDINALKSRLSALSGSFTGETATRWQDKFDEVSTQGNELMEAIGAIGDFLKQAADTLEQTDQELASNL